MAEENEKLSLLQHKLELLRRKQEDFSKEILALQIEINALKSAQSTQIDAAPISEKTPEPEIETIAKNVIEKAAFNEDEFVPPVYKSLKERATTVYVESPEEAPQNNFDVETSFEKFIGENLINKIGIAILIIGVFIGVRYSIEHDLISPLTRVICGYALGIGLLAIGMKLKTNYENFSAVLVSGAMAVMYFVTYAAYGLYELMPQSIAFGMMVLFTIFTVIAALNYDLVIIALIGLVGAYAVPFLLSNGSDRPEILFSYIALINTGILFIAFKKYWKSLYFTSFTITWLIYMAWFSQAIMKADRFTLAFTFLVLFFVQFYIISLAYKIIKKEIFVIQNVIVIMINTILFYGMGYALLSNHNTGQHLLGLFTLGNAIIHFIVSVIVYRSAMVDRNLFYLIIGFVLTFITIAIPVQLDGNWVTLLWISEALILFWIGRSKGIPFYEYMSYPLMALGIISLAHDWANHYSHYVLNKSETRISPLFNVYFLTSVLFITILFLINWVNLRYKPIEKPKEGISIQTILNFLLPVSLLLIIYWAFNMEISNYWDQLYIDSTVLGNKDMYGAAILNEDLLQFKNIWVANYTATFLSLISLMIIYKLKTPIAGTIALFLNLIVLGSFLTLTFFALDDLCYSYIHQADGAYFKIGFWNVGIRYVCFGFMLLLFLTSYKLIKDRLVEGNVDIVKKLYELILAFTILVVASNELMTWMDITKVVSKFKLGLTLLWGIYALILIIYGIWRKKKYMRLAAIGLFGITLFKLFLVDIQTLNTISKTILFVSLGILLLIISFLYNKFKDLILNDD